MDDTSPYVRELKKQHAAEVAKQEARIAELEEDRDNLRRWYNRAIDTVDRVFQVESGKPPPILPDFLRLGDDKFAGVVKLAEGYAELAAQREQIIEAIAPGNKDTLLGKYLRESTENIVAHLSEQRKGQDELIGELTADLKTHMHLVRTMGERCGLLGGLLHEVLNVEKQIGPNDTVVGPNAKLVEKIERALAQGEPDHDEG